MRNSRLPLNEVTRIKRVRWYRSPIEPQALRRLMQRSDLQGWLQAGGNLALFAATATLTWYLFLQQAWVGFALALYLHCTFGSFLSAACVDHGTFKTEVARIGWTVRRVLGGVSRWLSTRPSLSRSGGGKRG